jgi:hypothetical protein
LTVFAVFCQRAKGALHLDILGHHLPSLAVAGAAAVAAFKAVLAAFTRFDKDQSDDNRKFVRDWLQGLAVDDRHWTKFFTNLFENFFGSKHLSMKCVRRSFGLSVILIITIIAIWSIQEHLAVGAFILSANVLFLSGLINPSGCIADYLSLWKTRFLLTKSNMIRGWSTAAIVVVGDFIATTLIYIVCVMIGLAIIFIVVERMPILTFVSSIPTALRIILYDIVYPGKGFIQFGPMRLLFFATLLTSAWLWVYLVVAYAMRAASYLPKWLRPLSIIMDFENHPVRTIGYVAAALSAVIAGVFSLI